jgi:hypothetical protein
MHRDCYRTAAHNVIVELETFIETAEYHYLKASVGLILCKAVLFYSQAFSTNGLPGDGRISK